MRQILTQTYREIQCKKKKYIYTNKRNVYMNEIISVYILILLYYII